MKINICGDFTTVGRGIEAVEQKTAISDAIIDLFKSSDINIVNLESPVVTDSNYAIKKSGPNIFTSKITIEYLQQCNVNLVTLANNHFYDYGKHGIEQTITTLNSNNIKYIGGGLTPKEFSKIFYYEKDSIRIAILNYCESEFSVLEGLGCNPINSIQIYRDLQIAKKYSDFRIVICHGGHEGYQLPSPQMKDLFHFLIEAGANIVCNHHQHCYSGFEEYNKGKIFYGLGNFFFDDHRPLRQRSPIWNYGYIVSLDINSKGINTTILPYKQCLDTLNTVLLKDTEKISVLNDIEIFSNIISNDLELSKAYNNWCSKQQGNVLTWFSPYNNRLLQALCRRNLLPNFLYSKKKLQLYNILRCDSHRNLAINLLKKWI
jgi:hypothetical protein